MNSNSINYRLEHYHCETEYDEQVINYLKDYPTSIAQHHKKMNYETHRTKLSRKLKTFKDPVLVNNKPLFIIKYGTGQYLCFYDKTVQDYIHISVADDKPTKVLLRNEYPDYSEQCINKLNNRLWCRYCFLRRDINYPPAPRFYAQQPNNINEE